MKTETAAQLYSGGCTAAQVLVSLVPMLGVIFGSTLLFFFLLWQYRLRKELIRTNQYVPTFFPHIRSLSLLFGSLSVAAGLPLTLLLFMIDGLTYGLLEGLIPLSVGGGLFLFYYLHRE